MVQPQDGFEVRNTRQEIQTIIFKGSKKIYAILWRKHGASLVFQKWLIGSDYLI